MLIAAVVFATRMRLPADTGALLRLAILLPLGATVYTGSIFLLARNVVKDFLVFARTAFQGSSAKFEVP